MQIYLLRHGIAEEPVPGKSDSIRALTAEGKKKTRSMAGALAKAGVTVSLILTSPYRRALETAEIAATGLACKGQLVKTNALLPHVHPREVWAEIRQHDSEESILLVGHDPQMSQLAGFLLGLPELDVDFKKGAVMRLDLNQFGLQPKGELKWFLISKLIG